VRRTLQQVPPKALEPLLTSEFVKPELLPRLIALLQGHRNRQFTPAELRRLRAAQVVTTPVLLVAFRLAFARGNQNVDFELEQPYYLPPPARAGGGSTLYRQVLADFGQPASVLAQRHTVEALAARVHRGLARRHSLSGGLAPTCLAGAGIRGGQPASIGSHPEPTPAATPDNRLVGGCTERGFESLLNTE
jgi:hypothetical protein